MKTVMLHSDYIEFEAKKKALKEPEDIKEGKSKVEECLVVLSAVEKSDEFDTKKIAALFAKEIKDVARQVNTNTIVIYPWAHLSKDLSKPKEALEVLKEAESILSAEKYSVTRAPFGWYKSFTIKCKGHPLAELSREISITAQAKTGNEEEKESQALKNEKKLRSKWYILDLDGNLVPAEKFDFSKYPSLKTFYEYETSGTRQMNMEPPHIKIMRELELVDFEPGSDPGNLRWYPKGLLIKRLLEARISDIVLRYGAMEVETPLMYDYQHPQLNKYLNRFPARQYTVKSDDKEFFLRFAACFGQYLMSQDMTISYKQLPVKLYELTHFSFRREKSGELAGLKRLRSFTMPDMHTICKDMSQAKDEFKRQYLLAKGWMDGIDVEYDLAIRFVEDFYNENKDIAKELASHIKKPVIVELWNERFFYFITKFEFSVNDMLKKASTLSTVQIDVENTERFNITYTDADGKKKHPLLLHASISGGIDRNLWAILETQAMRMAQGKKPMLPLWLSPTQVRVIPLSEQFVDYAKTVAESIEKDSIRVDIDDRDLKMGKKIMEAEKEWTPYIVVIGENEQKKGTLSVRSRAKSTQEEISQKALIEEIKEKTKGMPFRPLPVPRLLSKRPAFVG